MIILTPQLSDAEAGEFVGEIKKLIAEQKGEVLSEDWLGRRKFAHPIGKHRDGFYIYLRAKLVSDSIAKIQRVLGLKQEVLRVSVFKAAKEKLAKK